MLKKLITEIDCRLKRLENKKRQSTLVVQGLKLYREDQEKLKDTMEAFFV